MNDSEWEAELEEIFALSDLEEQYDRLKQLVNKYDRLPSFAIRYLDKFLPLKLIADRRLKESSKKES